MASSYSCRACLRLARQEKRLFSTGQDVAKQSLAAAHAQRWRSTAFATSRTPITFMRSPSRSYAVQSDTVTVKANIAVPPEVKTSASAEQHFLDDIRQRQQKGERVGIEDDKGELHVLANIPDDVRTYDWRSSEWTWGVMERLYQDCEQAKLRFEIEEYVDEDDGKTKKRVIADENGMHAGIGEGWWYDVIGLPKVFNSYAIVCLLHMWILKVRLRGFPKQMHNHLSDLLANHFFWEAERVMDFVHKMQSGQRKKALEAYSEIWRGCILSLDEGLIKGDAVLAAAIWRLVFDGDKEVDPMKIALVTAYVRRELARVGRIDDRTLMDGYVGFGEPVSEAEILMQSPEMRRR